MPLALRFLFTWAGGQANGGRRPRRKSSGKRRWRYSTQMNSEVSEVTACLSVNTYLSRILVNTKTTTLKQTNATNLLELRLRERRLSLWFTWIVPSSGMLHSACWLRIDVSWLLVCPIFKSHLILENGRGTTEKWVLNQPTLRNIQKKTEEFKNWGFDVGECETWRGSLLKTTKFGRRILPLSLR